MDAAEYKAMLEACWLIAASIQRTLPLEALLKAARRADEIGPYLEPAMWSKNRPRLAQDIAMLDALAGVKRALDAMEAAATPPATAVVN